MQTYETDYYRWTQETSDHLKRGEFSQIELDALIDEVEDLGKKEQSALESRTVGLIAHLLKWDVQPERRSHSWQATIALQRRRIEKLLKQSPSLQPFIARNLADLYSDAVLTAVKETGLAPARFPAECPYTWQEILGDKPIAWPELK